jgi:hypothetical protein
MGVGAGWFENGTPCARHAQKGFESGAFNRALPPLRIVYNKLRDTPEDSTLPTAVRMALRPPDIRSTAACLQFPLRCAYRLASVQSYLRGVSQPRANPRGLHQSTGEGMPIAMPEVLET